MSIKTETLAELIFKASLFDKISSNYEPYGEPKIIELFQLHLEEMGKIKSPIEQVMYALLMHCNNGYQDIGIPEMEYPFNFLSSLEKQVKIGKYKVDFLIDTFICETKKPFKEHKISKIIIECDRHEFHEKTKEQAKHDNKRDRFLTYEGYKVLRFTGSEIYNDWEKIIEEISNILINDVYYWEKKNIELFEKICRKEV